MSEQLTIPHKFIPRNYQLDLFRYMDKDPNTARKAMLVWPRQIGKDTTCFAYMVKEAARVPGNYFYIFPTAEEAKKALWEKIMDDGRRLLDLLPEEAVERISNQEMSITVKGTHSTIRIIGLDKNPNAIRGVTPMGVVFSEFAYADITAYRALLPALRRTGCWHIVNSTPNGRNHFYTLHQGTVNSPDWYVSNLQSLWPERDGYIHVHSQKYFDDQVEQGMTTREDLEREYGCSFSTGMKGSFYCDQLDQAYAEGRISEYVYDDTLKVDTFWDLGISDSTAVWFRQKIGNKLIFIDYYEDSGKDLQHYVKMLENKGYEYGTHYLPHDAQQRSLQTGSSTANMFEDICKAFDISSDVWVLEKLPVQSGINAVRSRFKRYHFDAGRCVEGLKKLELYHRRFDKKRGTFIKEPVHDASSHAADAMRTEGMCEDLRQDGFWQLNNIEVISDYDILD